LLAALYDAAVAGVAPGPLTTAAMHAADDRSMPVRILALGKAAHAMGAAAVHSLDAVQSGRVAGGLIVAPDRRTAPHSAVLSVQGDHPMPGPGSFAAARSLGEQAALVRGDERALVLLSGGATSLVAAPLPGHDEGDLVRLFDLLHRSGLDIHAMNIVRKRFVRWGAGRLAVSLAPARVDVLVISDVPGDDIADVASGPCAPDDATAADVHRLLRNAALLPLLPPALRDHLEACLRGAEPETPKADHPAFRNVTTRLIGSNALAVAGALARARDLALAAEPGGMRLAGDAARCGEQIADQLVARATQGRSGCVVWGGETTVRRVASVVSSVGADGGGGRCQELALAAARRLSGRGDAARRVMLLAAGTDGRDGPTDAAGAFADSDTWSVIARAGVDGERALARHESYAALDAAGALFRPGATGTNVMDVVIGVVT
jgi:glycerate 2-kinase